MYSKTLSKLMKDLEKLPGIGEKTAERLALFIASDMEEESVKSLSENLITLKQNIKNCKVCNMLTEDDVCEICSNKNRDDNTIMVVSDSKDVFSLEKMKSYFGKYHVLGGLIDFSRGITDKDLSIDLLESRIPNIEELIIATNSTVEGEMTAKYLLSLFKDRDVAITRLAYGLPFGSDLRYADEKTLSLAVNNRKPFKED